MVELLLRQSIKYACGLRPTTVSFKRQGSNDYRGSKNEIV